MGDERHEKIQKRLPDLGARRRRRPEHHWHRARPRSTAMRRCCRRPTTLPREIASADVLTFETRRTHRHIGHEQDLIDKLGTDCAAVEQAARGIKGKRRGKA